MKKITWLLLFLFVLLLSYTVRYRIESNQNLSNWEVEKLQNQFDSLVDDDVFSQQEVKRSIMEFSKTWRTSIHDFPSLWIKIYSDDPYSESFKKESQFIIKNGNMLIDPFLPIQYIEIIAKDPNKDIGDIFKQKYFKQYVTWCKISIETGNSSYFTWEFYNNIIVYSVSPDALDHECYIGKVPYEKYTQIWYNSKKSDRYYVVNIGVWCAPGKCSVFNSIELY